MVFCRESLSPLPHFSKYRHPQKRQQLLTRKKAEDRLGDEEEVIGAGVESDGHRMSPLGWSAQLKSTSNWTETNSISSFLYLLINSLAFC